MSAVEDGAVTVEDKAGNSSEIPFGACVWATGVAMNPLIKQMQEKLPNQTHFRALLTDDKLRVLGSNDSIWAIGDASTIASPKALDYADELFEEADTVGDGVLSLSELRVRVSGCRASSDAHRRCRQPRHSGGCRLSWRKLRSASRSLRNMPSF